MAKTLFKFNWKMIENVLEEHLKYRATIYVDVDCFHFVGVFLA